MTTQEKNYAAQDIQVLKGLDPVRKLPGMYTRTSSPTHIIQEVLDNAADEALGGHADRLSMEFHRDGSVSVEDNGRGIPVDTHPEEGVPAAQLVFTQLHAGGKFRKGTTYAFSGGLHGVGVSVTNALSRRLAVRIRRDGQVWEMEFEGGEVTRPLAVTGTCGKSTTGTRITVWPDPAYFDQPHPDYRELERLLRSKAVLLPGVTAKIVRADGSSDVWAYPDGLPEYLRERTAAQLEQAPAEDQVIVTFSGQTYMVDDPSGFADGEGAAWALLWADIPQHAESFVNLIPTPQGGTHEAGLRSGVFEAVLNFATMLGMLPKNVRLQPEDVWSKTSFILSAKVLDPQFQGQTKDCLTSREALKLVAACVKGPLELWMHANQADGRRIAEMAIARALARTATASSTKKRASSSVVLLPEKLKDCVSTDASENEIILVEGDSAGGSAVQGRDKHKQAILFLRGKGLNAWETPASALFDNTEIADMATAFGVSPHEDPATDLSGMRYGRVIIMTDADVDGSHIQTLLLTLYLRHFPALLYQGRVFVAQPPLYCLNVPARGRSKQPARKIYVLDEAEKAATIEKLKKEGVPPESVEIGRFKGLGEMMPRDLWESALCPDTRRLLKMTVTPETTGSALSIFDLLMRKTKSEDRKAWLERRGAEVVD